MIKNNCLEYFFEPSRCAIIGASKNTNKAGNQIIKNLISSNYLNNGNKIFPINPSETGEVYGIEFKKSFVDIEDNIDLLVIAVSSNRIDEVVTDIENRMDTHGDLKAIITVSAGFSETGTIEGITKQELLLNCCRKNNIRVIGPNCVGIIDNINHFDSSFILGTKRVAGGISIISQSGAVGSWLLMAWASEKPVVGFNKFISLGNMADVNTVDCLEYLGNDEDTKVIGMYMEGYKNGRELMNAAKVVSRKKPILVLKVGKSKISSKAAQSHTGSLAGTDKIYDNAFKQYGILRVDSMEELSDTLRAFDKVKLPKSNRIFIISQAGGPGVYCLDNLADNDICNLASISSDGEQKLTEALPSFASIGNTKGYIDITAAADADQHRKAIEIVLEEDSVDALILITVPTLFVGAKDMAYSINQAVINLKKKGICKPILPVILYGDSVSEARTILEENGIMTVPTPDRAIKVLRQLIRYSLYLREGKIC